MSDIHQSPAARFHAPAALEMHRAAQERRNRLMGTADRPKSIAAPVAAPAEEPPPVALRDEASAVPAVPVAALNSADAESLARVEAAIARLIARRDAILEAAGARPSNQPRSIYLADILALVSRYFDVTSLDLMSDRRTKHVARVRQIGYYLARTHTLASLPAIGRAFGNRDHTTALYGIRKITRLLSGDVQLQVDVGVLSGKIEGLR
jgi:chromosomal replication initiator protein